MNRERMKELLPVMQHFANGGEVQFRSKNDTEDTKWLYCEVPPSWHPDYVYRIAPPPPRVAYRIEPRDGTSIYWSFGFWTEEEAQRRLGEARDKQPLRNYHLIRFIEQIEEQ